MTFTEQIEAILGEVQKYPQNDLRDSLTVMIGECLGAAKTMEENLGVHHLAHENVSLKSELDLLRKNHASELASLRSNHAAQQKVLREQIATIQKELDALHAEQAKRESKDPELPKDQLRILQALPAPSRQGWAAYEISNRLQILPDETDSHLHKLDLAKQIKQGNNFRQGNKTWTRSVSGNDYVITSRQAQEKPVKLSHSEEQILLLLSSLSEGAGDKYIFDTFQRGLKVKTWAQFKACLATLFCHGFIGAVSEFDNPTYGGGETVFIEPSGANYVSSNNLLE